MVGELGVSYLEQASLESPKLNRLSGYSGYGGLASILHDDIDLKERLLLVKSKAQQLLSNPEYAEFEVRLLVVAARCDESLHNLTKYLVQAVG